MRYVITHGHIFKNAGTTFDYALEKAFGKDFCDHRDDKDMRQGGAEYLKQFILDNPNLKAISSHHLCNPLPESDEFKCIPVYFVRNPIDRVLSVYNFERKQKRGSKGAEMASKLSLEDYVRWRMTPEAPKVIFDYQTAYIGRTRNLHAHEAVNMRIFQRALDIVVNEKALIGTVERFDESFSYISQSLSKYFPGVEFTFQKKNVTNQAPTEEKLRQALDQLRPVLAEVVSGNAYDMALYEVVNEKLNSLTI
ncbi:sulfotransferase family 2 domain-containing protein [Marinobacter sp. M216]|uniref:Sulfotransferase family 2 domain-containing protein n=1 Tax=Marinobacter albus TaxID=3030833 RepID=A0ABT7HA93_9GAMM|nr:MULTISPECIES: sulfotransferase family 2 domain-containing protein [unclassified Marinobacter]MBW7470473.1 sulfotransferase family protein [Marinobacter sp. F4218]MDK9557259.1 sulfotransferase family 2 domain-containing protein [Marinobacter sp. M216]